MEKRSLWTKSTRIRRNEKIKSKERKLAKVQSTGNHRTKTLIHPLIILFLYKSNSQRRPKTKMRFKDDIKTYGFGMGLSISIRSFRNIKWKVCFAKMSKRSNCFSEICILNDILSLILRQLMFISLMNKNLDDIIMQNSKHLRSSPHSFSRTRTQRS